MVASLKSLVIPLGPLPTVDTSWLGKLTASAGDALDKAGQTASVERNVIPAITGQPAQQQPSFLGRLFGGQQQAAAPQASAIPAPGAQAQMGAGSSPTAPNGVKQLISQYVPPEMQQYATNLIGKESAFNPSAVSPTGAKGLAQFTTGTGKQYGLVTDQGDSRADPVANLKAFVALTNDNRNSLTQALGRPPTDGELALAHQQGAQGAIALLSGKSVPGQNLAVNGVDPGTDPRAAAQKIMSYYGGSAGPTQVASLDPSVGMSQIGDNTPYAPKTEEQRAAEQARLAPIMAQVGDNTPVGGVAPQQAPYVDPQVTTAGRQAQPAPQPAMAAPAPQQPASNILAAAQPVSRQNISNDQIAAMVRDPNTRQIGLQLWQQVLGKAGGEPWQFVTLPDGTLARANQQTGAVEKVGQFAKPQAPVSVGSDSSLVDPTTGKVVYQGQSTKAPQVQEFFDQASGQGYKAQWNPETKQWDKVGGIQAKSGETITTNPDGTVTISKGTPGQPPKLTEDQSKASGFLVRANESQATLNDLEKQGTSLWNNTGGKIPLVGNFLRSEDAQKYDQAKRNFINAQLRRESGAVISPNEFANAEQQYFPQPGDGPKVIEQKRQNRQDAIRGLEIGSGPGAALAKQPQGNASAPAGKTSSGVQWSIEP